MKKLLVYSCSFLLAASLLCSCSDSKQGPKENVSTSSEESDSNALVGVWNGCDNAMAQDEEIYNATFLSITIDEDNSVILNDSGTKAQMIKGTIAPKDELHSIITITDVIDTNISGWENLAKDEQIQCRQLNDDILALNYENVCYFFRRSNSDLEEFSLLDQTVNEIWYSNDGSKKNEITYELSFNDLSFNLYELKKGKEANLLTTFVYQKNKDDQYTFFVYKNKNTKFPEIFDSLKEGFQSVDVTLTVKDNELVLGYNGKELPFYCNLIYGLKNGSDAHKLCNYSFQWPFDSENHFSYFTMNPDTDTLYLYVTDGDSPEYTSSVVCGAVTLDEKKKILTYHFDQDASERTAMPEDTIFDKCSSLDGEEIPYEISDKMLSLTIDGERCNFNLEVY